MRRRSFLKCAGVNALALTLPRLGLADSPQSRPLGANDDVRIAVLGIGAPGIGVGGRGRQLIGTLKKLRGVRIVALCDVDRSFLDHQAGELQDQGQRVAAYGDLRRVLDDPSVDAVVVAMPDHWHALATIWACQAGKDVYVEKPISYDLWEGRQIVAAAQKYNRIVQTGMQGRSSRALRRGVEFVQSGQLGKIIEGHVIVYRERGSIGKVAEPSRIPETVDYNLWCGPAAEDPVRRQHLHYDWHWVWSTGTGEIGNNGVHYLDMCRWAMKLNTPAPRAMSIGGRFGYVDDGETPNTQLAVLDYDPAPIYCEIRGLPEKRGGTAMGAYRDVTQGILIQCEGGHFSGSHLSGAAFDTQGTRIKEFAEIAWDEMETAHLSNFVAAVRSRKSADLSANALEGHLSAACCHMVNISHRLGKAAGPSTVAERTQGNKALAEAWARYQQHLRANDVDFNAGRGVVGPWVTLAAGQERFVSEFGVEANQLLRRDYRKPFAVPELA